MKVIVTGASGLLGRAMMKEFEDVSVLGIARTRGGDRIRLLDLGDYEAVHACVAEFEPDVIVHCAAMSDPDYCEGHVEEIRRVNVGATEYLAQLGKEMGFWVLTISSDYVFSGKQPPYKPNSPVDPVNEYGRSKADAERAARVADDGSGVLRVPILYGPVESLDESSVSKVLKAVLDTSKHVQLDDVQARYPTYVGDVAHVCRKLAERKITHCGLHGVWHFSGTERLTKYGMAKLLAKAYNVSADHISANKVVAKTLAARPLDSRLDCTTLKLMGLFKTSSFEEMAKVIKK